MKKNYQCPLDPLFFPIVQCCLISLPLADKSHLNLVLVYRPRNLYNNESVIQNNEKLNNIISNVPRPSVIFGDFNYSDIDWSSMHSEAHSRQFLNTVQVCFFTQHVNFVLHTMPVQVDTVYQSKFSNFPIFQNGFWD